MRENTYGPTGDSRRQRPNELFPTTAPSTTLPDFSGSVFSDPYSALFENVAKQRMSTLSQPFSDPALDDVVNLIRGQIGKLSSSSGPSFGGGNSMFGDFVTQGRQRIAELNQAPFSATEEAAMKTRARDDLTVQRDQARKRITEDAGRRNILPSSGVVGAEVSNLERGFTTADAKAQNDLVLWMADQAQQRKNQATGIAGQLAQMGAAEEGMADSRAIASANFEQSRNAQIMQAASSLAEIAAQKRGEMRANQNDVLQIAMQLSQLTPQRLALAMNVLNGTGGNDMSGLFNNTLNLSNTQTNNRNMQDSATAAFLEGISKMLSYYGARR
jgi:hypothetical protein